MMYPIISDMLAKDAWDDAMKRAIVDDQMSKALVMWKGITIKGKHDLCVNIEKDMSDTANGR